MDQMWEVYMRLGWEHILDIKGYDHMLFLLALCLPFTIKDWKKVLILATAFTIGHSVTLALSTLDIVRFPTSWVEFLIPLTIVITAIYDLFRKSDFKNTIHYALAMFFGLIHGMGFSNFLRASVFPGEENQLVWQLLYFNIGIELGQVLVVIIFLLILWAFAQMYKAVEKNSIHYYTKMLAIGIVIWAGWMCFERWPL